MRGSTPRGARSPHHRMSADAPKSEPRVFAIKRERDAVQCPHCKLTTQLPCDGKFLNLETGAICSFPYKLRTVQCRACLSYIKLT